MRQICATRPVARRISWVVSLAQVLQKRNLTGRPVGLAGCETGCMGLEINSNIAVTGTGEAPVPALYQTLYRMVLRTGSPWIGDTRSKTIDTAVSPCTIQNGVNLKREVALDAQVQKAPPGFRAGTRGL